MNQTNTIKNTKHSKQPSIWIWALTLLLIAALVAATAWYFAKRRAMRPGKISINAVAHQKTVKHRVTVINLL